MARTQTMVQLTNEILKLLDAEAAGRRISRSALIREVLDAHIASAREALIGAQIVEGYRRVPPGIPDEWGDLDAQVERSTREMMQRLDAEERAAGYEKW